MEADYLNSAKQQFRYYKQLGDKTIEQLTDSEIFLQVNENSNSVAIVIKHLWGNMMSRWTDFLTSDGEKDWRERDQEFEIITENKADLLHKWEEGWDCLFNALDQINSSNIKTVVYIRNQGHSITEAINRQMMHYAYHIGQLVFIGKMIRGKEWTSLSIPKGASKDYNLNKFSKPKERKNFTEEYLK